VRKRLLIKLFPTGSQPFRRAAVKQYNNSGTMSVTAGGGVLWTEMFVLSVRIVLG